jgi:aspartate kinase
MNVFKFGGASLKSPEAIINVASIIKAHQRKKLLVVLSAMGSTTDALEKIIELGQSGRNFENELHSITNYHTHIIKSLVSRPEHLLKKLFDIENEIRIAALRKGEYDFIYDQIIGYGEILSSVIVYELLIQENIEAQWIDSREFITTDNTFREGQIRWGETEKRMNELKPVLKDKMVIAQGFIAYNEKNETVSLGREGSDFSAAIFGSALGAESVTIWKDVPGLMNADPKRIADAVVFEELPYKETAEMTYYGASVIHPKTIKPLANRGIPLLVKSFIDPALPGTKIHECHVNKLPPLIVHKENQCLISCRVTDYTFINEEQLGYIFHSVSESGMRVNVMQNSAISFSFCVDYTESRVLKLIGLLSKKFEVFYNIGLMLITVKNYDARTFNEYRNNKGAILEQSSRSALQVLVKDP